MRRKSGSLSSLILLIVIFATLLVVWVKRDAVYDWLQLRNYQPSTAVTSIADQTTLTAKTRHLFYVNHPAIQNKSDFNKNCPNNGGEQTIVLGCYHARQTGIYLYDVADPKLAGVVQVTAAHETLHAAYERLSTKDRNYVDGLLQDYYQHDLHDQRLLDTIAAYQKSEPNDVVNEMHSVFGTEVRDLPPALEAYYKQYFSDRLKIVTYSEQYEQTFTNLKTQVDQYDTQLASLKKQIDGNQSSLQQQSQDLQAERKQLDDELASKQYDAYNAGVPGFNQKINNYNAQLQTTKQLIDQYNSLLDTRNATALQQQQLFKAIDSQTLPAEQQ
jgi:uncharacterized protein YukE